MSNRLVTTFVLLALANSLTIQVQPTEVVARYPTSNTRLA
jgi:hypothetical protein